MDSSLLIILGTVVLSIIGVPIGTSLIAACLSCILITHDLPLMVMSQKVSTGVDSFIYVAIPLYILAGAIMEGSGITDKLMHASRLIIGHVAGGLAQVNVLVSMIFAGVSGSALSDVASIGPVIIPAMKKAGFSAQFSAAITAASSLIGPIIPPSICFVVYASLTNVSVGKMFLGGFIPGIIMGVLMMIMCWYMARKHNYPCYPRAALKEVASGIFTSLPALMMPAIIILGIGFGFFTPTESAAVAVAYGLIYSIIVKTFSVKNFIRQLHKSALTTSATMFIVGGATILGYLLTIEGTPRAIATFLANASENAYVVMLAIGGFMLVVGMFMSVNAALVILIPIFIPIMQHFQLDPVWFGVLTCLWLGIGLVTPPVCSCLQLACKIADISLMDGFKAILPFFLMLIIMCILITFFPAIITVLPNKFMP